MHNIMFVSLRESVCVCVCLCYWIGMRTYVYTLFNPRRMCKAYGSRFMRVCVSVTMLAAICTYSFTLFENRVPLSFL